MTIKIDHFDVGVGRAFVIAEIGNNHNGSFERAIEMVDKARAAGADCVKFQMRHLDQVYRQRSLSKSGDDLGTEYVIDLLNRFELNVGQHRLLAAYCAQAGIPYMCTPWDGKSVDVLEDIGVPAYKVASADLTNLPLLDRLVQTGKPLILSTGMSTTEEVEITVAFLNKRGSKFALLHCNSTYPAPLHDINLKWMLALRQTHPLVGYSGHERGINVSLAAAALGACIIERHFTLDRTMEGPDHAASLTQSEFARMVEGVREIEQALGEGKLRHLSQGEMINRENLGKSLVASKALSKGTVLRSEHIKVRSPGQGLSPQKYEALLGRTLCRDMGEEDFFFPTDLQDARIEPRNYRFTRPWGIPVRYHDFREYAARIQPDLWEFHLSYSDMDLDPDEYLDGPYQAGLVVHAPELFSGSRLMDLATPDDTYRNESIRETQRVINIARNLKRYFPNTMRPPIVANIGGFTMDAPLPASAIRGYYERFAESLGELDLEGVELIPQTMAPFPWHFGGQRYQNIFVKVDEIVDWCNKLKLRMCFDISHTRLTCNHFGVDFYEFAEKIAPFSSHLHLGDARGLNGEGLQVGEGEIDFARLGGILQKGCPDATFIPEIWQGHKNGGEGFWVALERLEGVL
ncbi:MAG: N-acetylneuraminate synthase family protein [Gammaproteobacteria bacterium]|nr:N-acetylneuraminate synthase family protein [Gammaproteobacteria bacterium]MBU0788296.1 N-acetylneuraminate synthase family protein [Gammaproteobacteria bacterium]MBU0815207.1 N-acetylneuraminate synthase family protein [Gammaproteobacteria bacterium]MBU1785685.1 N-acetylneuraminate synthase family protein [Gammaproteobacteria bacterium]